MRRISTPAALAATALYLALTIALTWPLVLHPGSLVPHDPGDPLLNTWIMSWNARVPPLTTAWWNAAQFFPAQGATAFSEHLLGLSVLTTPIIWLSGNPLLAYNVAFFSSFVLCALSAYALTLRIAGRHDAALVAGLAFGFAPYRMSQLAHVQVLSSYWMPLALLGLHGYFEDHRNRWLWLFAVAWLMQALTCGYYLFYLSVLVALWLLWFAAGREPWRQIARVVFAWAAAALVMTPVLYGYWTIQRAYGMRRWPNEIIEFSADVASILKAPDEVRLWGWLNVVDHPESALFPGLTIVLLILVALGIRWRAAARTDGGRPKALSHSRRPLRRVFCDCRIATLFWRAGSSRHSVCGCSRSRPPASRCQWRCCCWQLPVPCIRPCGRRGSGVRPWRSTPLRPA